MSWRLRPDPWLAGLLGRRACRAAFLPDEAGAGFSTPQALRQALEAEGPAFAYARVGADAPATWRFLEQAGFRLVEASLTLERPCDPDAPDVAGVVVSAAAPQDAPAVARLAETAFRYSRFHADPDLPDATADAIKRAWAENYFAGKRGETMAVARIDGQVAGFLLLVRDKETAVIDLIAVDAAWRRRGAGAAMIAWIQRTMAQRTPRLRTATQTANLPALRLYARAGMLPVGAAYALHFHHGTPL
ncbi:MAG: GNAT family N-acetyltransferase [Desulfovibrio sp.]